MREGACIVVATALDCMLMLCTYVEFVFSQPYGSFKFVFKREPRLTETSKFNSTFDYPFRPQSTFLYASYPFHGHTFELYTRPYRTLILIHDLTELKYTTIRNLFLLDTTMYVPESEVGSTATLAHKCQC